MRDANVECTVYGTKPHKICLFFAMTISFLKSVGYLRLEHDDRLITGLCTVAFV